MGSEREFGAGGPCNRATAFCSQDAWFSIKNPAMWNYCEDVACFNRIITRVMRTLRERAPDEWAKEQLERALDRERVSIGIEL